MEIRRSSPIIFALFAVAIFFTACTKYNPDVKSTNLPVIESYLVPGQPISVKLYQQKALTDTAQYGAPITGVQMFLSDGTQKVSLTESATKGTYTYADNSILATGKTYTLQFDYNGYPVSASSTMPAKPVNFVSQNGGITISSGQGPGGASTVLNVFSWSNPDSLYHVLAFKAVGAVAASNSFGGNRPINLELNAAKASYYNITNGTFFYLGNYQAILFSVNKEYFDLISNNTRTATSQSLIQTPTNIINGFGVFTAMQADTLSFVTY
ncbi:DUF4249 family protein [Mucilaginibacter sp. dw_454]|uniref:DUF4249 family protein n=1 Tax=Mucilaginibacter sp. dw_454 TaxID=2720079 RepID=UPI001BD4D942|nr:DUF4249 family protein [Mucilaginibacter sp. dw_454]